MARPTKFTAETVSILIRAIRAGLTVGVACEAAGIDDAQFYRWQRGEFPRGADPELKRQFRDDLTRAKARASIDLAEIVMQAGEKDWRAALELLRVRHPESFSKDREVIERLERLEALAQDQQPQHPGLRRMA